jgi:hypothetical protein
VRKTSWSGRLRGGDWQARRKCEMFSIWIKGIADFLNLTPGEGIARFTSLFAVIWLAIYGNGTQHQPDSLAQGDTILQSFKEVARRQTLPQYTLYP